MKEGRLKSAVFTLLQRGGLLALCEARARGVPILAYHGVTAADPGAAERRNRRRLHVPEALFARHLHYLQAHYRPLPLLELSRALRLGRALPERAVVLTFDDGYRNLLTRALPLLLQHGVPATLFVVAGDERGPFWHDRLEAALEAAPAQELDWRRRRYELRGPHTRAAAAEGLTAALQPLEPAQREQALAEIVQLCGGAGDLAHEDRCRLDWDELRRVQAAGVEIGSHGWRHEPLTHSEPAEQARELQASRECLDRELGPRTRALSYPFGARAAATREAAGAAGFDCAVSGAPRLVRTADDRFDLGRFLVGADDDLPRLRAALCGLRGVWQGDPWPAQEAP